MALTKVQFIPTETTNIDNTGSSVREEATLQGQLIYSVNPLDAWLVLTSRFVECVGRPDGVERVGHNQLRRLVALKHQFEQRALDYVF